MNNNKDGIYIETFFIQNGERHNLKITSMHDFVIILSNSMMNGVEKLIKEE